MAITGRQQEKREEGLVNRGRRWIHPGLLDIPDEDVRMDNPTRWSDKMITEEDIDRLVIDSEQYAVIRSEEQQVHDNRKEELSHQISLIANSINDTSGLVEEQDPKKKLKNKSKWTFGVLSTGMDTHGVDTMLEAWNYYFEDNREHKKMYEDLLELIMVRAIDENQVSKISLISDVYEQDGRIRNVMKRPILCRYYCYHKVIGQINPGGGGYSAGCLANEYGFCQCQHPGDLEWDHAVSLARNDSRYSDYRFPQQQKTVATGPFVGAGAGGRQQNNRQENRVWATTTVAQNSANGKAPRDMSNNTSKKVNGATFTNNSSVGGARNGHRSHNNRTQVVGGASSTTTSAGGAGNGNRMQQQTYQTGKDKGKSEPKNQFATLQDESSDEEE